MDLPDSLSYHITRCGHSLRQLTAKKIKEADIDLTPEEAVLMTQLWHKDNQTVIELGSWSVKGPSTITRQMDGLVKKGYVDRIPGTDDRRKIYQRITPKGKKLKTKFGKTDVINLDQSIKGISQKDLATALKVIKKIREHTLEQL